MTHMLMALAIQLAAGLAFGLWRSAAVSTSAFYFGREITQAEYRWISAFGGGKRANMPWWGGFDYSVWDLKSAADAMLPFLATFVVVLLVRYSYRG